MNAKFIKLLSQATELADEEYGYDGSDYAEIVQEKFAELIVRECASIAGKAEYSDTWTEPVEDTIKKHFGVEE